MTVYLNVPELELPEEEAQQHFDRLQARLEGLWPTISEFNDDEQTIVVIPSVSLDFDLKNSEMQAYEERFLFLLLLLRQPSARVVYVTSQPVRDEIVDYYLALLPGVIPSHARRRLFMVSVGDPEPIALTAKILRRPRFIERLRSLILDPRMAHMVPFNTTRNERDLAIRLGIPMYGCDPKHEPLGTKSGGRKIFMRAGVPHPTGFEDLSTLDQVLEGVRELKMKNPACPAVMVKHDAGVSGEGNAVVDLKGLDGKPSAADIEKRVRTMTLEKASLGFDGFMEKFERLNGIVEERIVADAVTSPSVQLRITPFGKVELLSTHDQLLGGPSGQSYLGCIFPAADDYATAIAREADKIGQQLVGEGVIGRFAVDFLTAKRGDSWDAFAIELNLRKGGTTHPFLTLQFLTDGKYDTETNRFLTVAGHRKCFIASDHIESEALRLLDLHDLLDISVRNRLHFDAARQKGMVLHMMSCLGECGRFGFTAVADDPEEAEALYQRSYKIFLDEAERAGESGPIPPA